MRANKYGPSKRDKKAGATKMSLLPRDYFTGAEGKRSFP